MLERPVRLMNGNRRDSRYLPAFAASLSANSSNTSLGVDLEPARASPHRASVDPNSGNRKERVRRGATKRSSCELKAASDKMIQVACRIVYSDVDFTWSFQLEACRSIARDLLIGCIHTRRAIALYRSPAVHSVLACGLDDHGELSARVASGWCHR